MREITETESLFKVEEGGQFEIDVHTEGSYVNSGEPCEHWIWQVICLLMIVKLYISSYGFGR